MVPARRHGRPYWLAYTLQTDQQAATWPGTERFVMAFMQAAGLVVDYPTMARRVDV